MKKSILITLEGNEGCGKTTQIKLLRAFLRKKGHKVFLTREPGGTRTSDGIRKVLLDNKNKAMSPVTETLLYMASRSQLVTEVIQPRLRAGFVVLCDRWLDATVAYQGYGGGVDVRWIGQLGDQVTQGIRPKLTIFLDLPLEVGLRRATSRHRADRIEKKSLSFHKKVREGYRAVARRERGRFRWLKISPADSAKAVHERIRKMVADVI